MSELSTQCPHCRVKMKLKNPELAGKAVKCPSCTEAFVVEPLAVGNAVRPSLKRPARQKSIASKSENQDIDFPLADDEVLDADEVAADPGSDDDWLSDLETLAPKGPIGAKPALAPAPAPVAGRPRKKKTDGKKRRRSIRDPDGEFPLWLSRLIMVGTGMAAGALCVVIWAAMIAKTGIQHPYMALFIGVTVGTGVRFGASKWDFGWFPAITASLIALAAIIGGKVYGVHTMRSEAAQRETEEQQQMIEMLDHPNYPIHLVALEIRDTNIEAGLDEPYVDWGLDAEELPAQHGETRWAAAQAQWGAMPEEQRAEYREAIADEHAFLSELESEPVAVNEHTLRVRGMRIPVKEGSRTQVLSVLDFVFAGFAIYAAFRIAAGMVDDGSV